MVGRTPGPIFEMKSNEPPRPADRAMWTLSRASEKPKCPRRKIGVFPTVEVLKHSTESGVSKLFLPYQFRRNAAYLSPVHPRLSRAVVRSLSLQVYCSPPRLLQRHAASASISFRNLSLSPSHPSRGDNAASVRASRPRGFRCGNAHGQPLRHAYGENMSLGAMPDSGGGIEARGEVVGAPNPRGPVDRRRLARLPAVPRRSDDERERRERHHADGTVTGHVATNGPRPPPSGPPVSPAWWTCPSRRPPGRSPSPRPDAPSQSNRSRNARDASVS